ncbi:MAG: hypothetical protein ACC707_11620, partial [Thiohalomonadales bacterium]
MTALSINLGACGDSTLEKAIDKEKITVTITSNNGNFDAVTGIMISLDARGGSGPYAWSVDEENNATITKNGDFIGLQASTVTVTAKDSSGNIGTTTIVITDADVLSISITPSTATIISGDSKTYIVTAALSNQTTMDITRQVTWSSDNTANIRLPYSRGKVKSKAGFVGESIITVSFRKKATSTTLTVAERVITVTAAGNATSVALGSTLQMSASGFASRNYSWSVGDAAISSIDNRGLLRVLLTATIADTITVTATDGSRPIFLSTVKLKIDAGQVNGLTVRNHGVKKLSFSWSRVQGASDYKLLYQAKSGLGYSQVEDNVIVETIDTELALHRTDWINASYIVEACVVGTSCIQSLPISISDLMLQAIGYFKASNTKYNSRFGASVSISSDGNTLAVGAYSEGAAAQGVNGNQIDDCTSSFTSITKVNCAPDSGAVYVYSRDVFGVWNNTPVYIKASNTESSENFGAAVSLSSDGNTLAVTAIYEDSAAQGVNSNPFDDCSTRPSINCAKYSGAVYIYSRDALGVWDNTPAYIKASNTDTWDGFGGSISLSGDGNTLAVSASSEDSAAQGINGEQIDDCYTYRPTNCALNSGAVYIYRRDALGVWNNTPVYIKATNAKQGDSFGGSVSLSSDGDTLAVGASQEDSAAQGVNGEQIDDCIAPTPTNCAPESGTVYVYSRSAFGVWNNSPVYIKASNTNTSDYFGGSISLSGDGNTLAVGASSEDSAAQGINGEQIDDCYTYRPTNCALNSGAVYIYRRDALGVWNNTPVYIKATNAKQDDSFGGSVSLSSDGDTLAVGAGLEDSAVQGVNGNQVNDCDALTPTNCATDSGAVYVYYREVLDVWDNTPVYIKASNTEAGDN